MTKHPTEEQAREIIEAFLCTANWDGNYSLELQEAGDPEETAWAFWVVDEEGDSSPLTSYVHADGTIETHGIGKPKGETP